MLSGFLAWWVRQLALLLPRRLRDPRGFAPATIVSLEFRNPGTAAVTTQARAAIALSGKRGRQPLCRFALDEAGIAAARAALAGRRRPKRVVLSLPAAALLEREVALPLAAEWDPEAVLGHEMDRLTPFRSADVVWTARTVLRDRARNRLLLHLSLVPRAFFAGWLPALARLGLVPELLEVALPCRADADRSADRSAFLRLPLLRHEGAGRNDRRILIFAGALVGGLAVAAVALPFLRQSLAERTVAARIQALRPAVAEVLALRRRIGGEADGADAIAGMRAEAGDPLQVLAALTGVLPDDTYLESLALSHRHLAITGRSTAAARLISLLTANPLLDNPAFAAPITRAPEGGDEFTIRADVAR